MSKVDVAEVVDSLIDRFQELIKARFLEETDARECAVVVRALDRFYRRLSSCNQLLTGEHFAEPLLAVYMTLMRHFQPLTRHFRSVSC